MKYTNISAQAEPESIDRTEHSNCFSNELADVGKVPNMFPSLAILITSKTHGTDVSYYVHAEPKIQNTKYKITAQLNTQTTNS